MVGTAYLLFGTTWCDIAEWFYHITHNIPLGGGTLAVDRPWDDAAVPSTWVDVPVHNEFVIEIHNGMWQCLSQYTKWNVLTWSRHCWWNPRSNLSHLVGCRLGTACTCITLAARVHVHSFNWANQPNVHTEVGSMVFLASDRWHVRVSMSSL